MALIVIARLFLLRYSQEAVAWIFFDNAVLRQVAWFTLFVLLYLREEVDGLWFAAAQGDLSLVQVVGSTFRVCVLVSHDNLYLLLALLL